MIFPYEYRVLWEVAARGPSRRDVMWMGSGRLPSSAILASLRRRGLIESDGSKPAVWSLTEKGRGVVHGDERDGGA